MSCRSSFSFMPAMFLPHAHEPVTMHGLSAEGSRYGTTKSMFVPGLRSLRAWRSTKRSAGSPPCGEYDQARVLHGRWGVHPNTVLCRGRRPPRRPWAGPRTEGTGLPLPRTAHALSLIHISEPTRLGMISY